MMSLMNKDCRSVFQRLGSLVDLGGGKGLFARIISEAFPQLKCTVFDLPHVVSDLPDCGNLKYVGGDMFHSVLSAMPSHLRYTHFLLHLYMMIFEKN